MAWFSDIGGVRRRQLAALLAELDVARAARDSAKDEVLRLQEAGPSAELDEARKRFESALSAVSSVNGRLSLFRTRRH